MLYEHLARSQVETHQSEAVLNSHAIRAIASRRAHRRAARSAALARHLNRSAVSSRPNLD
jgi:hypothetical protein